MPTFTPVDKSHLSDMIKEKQKQKGTYDSPCLSVCDYDETSLLCQTCGLYQSEKRTWKEANEETKCRIHHDVLSRRK